MEDRKPQEGTWTLTAPDGQEFKAGSPLKCCQEERNARVPAIMQLQRVEKFINACDLCGEDPQLMRLAPRTPAEIRVCLTCKNTIFNQPWESV